MRAQQTRADSTKGIFRRSLLGAGIGMISYGLLESVRQNQKVDKIEPRENEKEMLPTFQDDVVHFPQVPKRQSVPSREEIIRSFAHQVPAYWGLEAPGVLKRLPGASAGAALTVDFCGGPGGNAVDMLLLNTLRDNGIPATLFLNSRWISANPLKSRELANDPLFELANHGSTHSPLSVNGRSAYGLPGTKAPEEIYDEIMLNNAVLEDLTGRPQLFFRPGTAYLDDVAAQIVHTLGITPVGFSINGDGGATFTDSVVSREISVVAPGDIVIIHGNHPEGGTAQGLIQALTTSQTLSGKFIHFPPTVP
jgi:peptidoglycan/xylan/chitin deacetylase (PgdA/CDA1 family)